MSRLVYLPTGVYEETGERQVLVGNSLYDETFSSGGDTVNAVRVDNVSTIFTANIVLKPTAARFDNSTTYYTATASFQVDAARVDNQSVFYTAVATLADVVQPARIDNSSVFYTAAEVSIVTAARVDNSSTYYTASATEGDTVTADRVDNTTTYYTHSLNFTVYPDRVDNVSDIYMAVIDGEGDLIYPNRFDNSSTFYGLQVDRAVYPDRLESASEVFGPSGFLSVRADRVESNTLVYTVDYGGEDDIFPVLFENSTTFYLASAVVTAYLDSQNEIYKPGAGAPGSFMFQDVIVDSGTEFYPPVIQYTLPYIDHSIMPVGTQPYGMGWDRIIEFAEVLDFAIIYDASTFPGGIVETDGANTWFALDESKTWYPVEPLSDYETTEIGSWNSED